MKQEQKNKLKMGQATRAFLNDEANAGLWQGIAGIEEGLAELDEIIRDILKAGQKQTARDGYAVAKRGSRETMVQAAFKVCCGLTAMASSSKNAELAAQVSYSLSGLAKGSEEDVVSRCQTLADLGTANAAALAAKFDVAANDLAALAAAIAEFKVAQPRPRKGRAKRASATKQLAELFADLDEVLNRRLDPLLAKFKSSKPEFYTAYRTARSIVNFTPTRETKEPEVTPVPTALAKAA